MRDRVPGFAARFRELRERAGLSVKQLAERAGLGLATIYGFEKGPHEPRLAAALRLADALGCKVEDFRHGK